MKSHLAIFVTALFTYALPGRADTTAKCEDLSHSYVLKGMSVDYKQIGCEKYDLIFRGPDREPYSEGQQVFTREFHRIQVDDAYETTSNQQRWMFSSNGKSIIHEAIIDSLNKGTRKKSFRSRIEIISRMPNGNIERASSEIVRTEDAEGIVKVATESDSKEYLPLSNDRHPSR